MHAIGTLAIPVLRHIFRIINCHQEEREKLGRNHTWTASYRSRH
jgi:hypothetical protein